MALMALSGVNTQPKMDGVLDIATGVLDAGVIPGGGLISSALTTLTGLLKGHSDYFLYDQNFGNKKYDLVAAQAITWYNKGKDINQFDFSRIWSDTNHNPSVVGAQWGNKRRIDMLVEVYNQTKLKELIPIINTAVQNGLLPSSNKISLLTPLFGGGSTTPGASSGISTPLIIGGVAAAAVIGFLIFKKK